MKKIYIFLIGALIFSANSSAQILSESFDASTFPPMGWTNTEVVGTGTDVWIRASTTTQTNPNSIIPHTGAGMALYDAYNYEDGSIADLVTPALNFTGGVYRVSFWMYRDQRYLSQDSLVVYVNASTPTAIGGTKLGKIIRQYINNPVEIGVGWYQYSFNIPASFNTASNYIIFSGYSVFGTEIVIDDVVVDAQPSCQAPATITPSPINTTSITLNWSAVSGTLGYEYVVDALATDPTGAGTPVVTNTVTTTNSYTLGSTYYAHVRTACTGSTFSTWKTIPVIIPPLCTSNILPANLATGISNPVSLSWTASTGATSYNVFLSTDNGITYNNVGNIASTTTATLNLVSSGTFYWYVQPSNGGVASGCQSSATSFTTVVPVANDVCTLATLIPCGGSITGDNTHGFSDLLPAVTCGSTSATTGTNNGVWFKVTPTLSGSLTVSACTGTTWDTYMRVYGGSCGAFTSCLGFNDDGCGSQSSVTFTAVAGTTYYVLLGGYGSAAFGSYTISATCPASCPVPTAVTVGSITLASASVTWTGTGTNILEYGLTGFTPGTGATAGVGGTIINPATSPQAITGLANSTTYQVYLRQDCTGASNGYSANSLVTAFTTLFPPPINDEASGAIALTVGGTCTGAIYNNSSATQSALEPFPSCKGTAGYGGMWYKFVAPASGSVKISCDENDGTFGDSRMALYSATNAADYTTFNIIACDDDNGVVVGARSLFYYSGLTAGTTYYVLVDLYSSSTTRGSYCITVDELSSSMLSSTAAGCDVGSSLSNFNAAYTGWVSLVDGTGNLNVNVHQTAGNATDFSCSRTITTGPSRVDGLGQAYLNRNFLVTATGATSAELQLFFLNTEVATLGGSIAGYNVSRAAGAVCNSNFAGPATLLLQTGNGAVNGVSYIKVTTPGFSNFYIHNSSIVLPISIEYFKGTKQSSANYLDWKVTCTSAPSLKITLERSADGRDFKYINEENALAVRCLQAFDYTDATPLAGANYYRLKLTTPTGEVNYSKIVVLLNKEKGFELISIAPNPIKNSAGLTLASVKAGKIDIAVSDVKGKVVAKQMITIIAGNNTVSMDFATLGAGTYVISAKNADGEVKITRFVKY